MKKILVIAEDADSTVNDVIHWLRYLYQFPIIRINETDIVSTLHIYINASGKTHFGIQINGNEKILSEDIVAYWYRRGALANNGLKVKTGTTFTPALHSFYNSVNSYYQKEWEHITGHIHYVLRRNGIPNLNSFFDLECNKLINLEVAKEVGFLVPHGIVTNIISEVKSFLKSYPRIIVKPVRSPGSRYSFQNYEVVYSQKTNLFSLSDLDKSEEEGVSFQPTHFQEYIEKDFEIRAFYLKGKFYSMAIFSQNNEKTQIDFRDYDQSKPNRNVPFQLPNEIERKVTSLMQKLDYDTGSVDLIYNHTGYYFLEVNTVGQLKWVSNNCNYYIEKEIASTIINK